MKDAEEFSKAPLMKRAWSHLDSRALARRAHKSYWAPVNTYDAKGYNRKVHRITKRQLNRAANEVTDLIHALR